MTDPSVHRASSSPALTTLARNLELIREHHRWSGPVLAARAGISVSLAKHIVKRRANPRIADLLRLANVAGLSLSDVTDPAFAPESPAEAVPAPRYRDPEAAAEALRWRLREHRVQEGFTRRSFAESTGISRNTLLAIESMRIDFLVEELLLRRGDSLSFLAYRRYTAAAASRSPAAFLLFVNEPAAGPEPA